MKKNDAIYEEITKYIWNELNLSVTLQKKYRVRIKKLELWKQGNYKRVPHYSFMPSTKYILEKHPVRHDCCNQTTLPQSDAVFSVYQNVFMRNIQKYAILLG